MVERERRWKGRERTTSCKKEEGGEKGPGEQNRDEEAASACRHPQSIRLVTGAGSSGQEWGSRRQASANYCQFVDKQSLLAPSASRPNFHPSRTPPPYVLPCIILRFCMHPTHTYRVLPPLPLQLLSSSLLVILARSIFLSDSSLTHPPHPTSSSTPTSSHLGAMQQAGSASSFRFFSPYRCVFLGFVFPFTDRREAGRCHPGGASHVLSNASFHAND